MINLANVTDKQHKHPMYNEIMERILSFLQHNGPADFWAIFRKVGGSNRRILRLLDEMIKANLLTFTEGAFRLPSDNGFLPTSSSLLCPTCHGKGVYLPAQLERVQYLMEQVGTERPAATFLFDQYPVNIATTMNRLAYFIQRGDIHGRNIAVIGDDDLTGLALAATGLAKKVTIFEIDRRLVRFIQEQADRHQIQVEAVEVDITGEIPDSYKHHYDMFFTDPTPVIEAFAVFVSGALALLKPTPRSVGYVSIFSSRVHESTLPYQKLLSQMGLAMTDLLPNFNEYEVSLNKWDPDDQALYHTYITAHVPDKKVSFYESLLRFETTELTRRLPIEKGIQELHRTELQTMLDELLREQPSQTGEEWAYLSGIAHTFGKQQP